MNSHWRTVRRWPGHLDAADFFLLRCGVRDAIDGDDRLLILACQRDSRLLFCLAASFRRMHGKRLKSWASITDDLAAHGDRWLTFLDILISASEAHSGSSALRASPSSGRLAALRVSVSGSYDDWLDEFADRYSGHSKRKSRKVRRTVRKTIRRSLFRDFKRLDPSFAEPTLVELAEDLGKPAVDAKPSEPSAAAEVTHPTVANTPNNGQTSPEFGEALHVAKLKSLRLLAYGASHEINNPLANIAMRAELLAKSESDGERKKKLKIIQHQAMRAHQMISDLMLFAHPPALDRKECELIELVKEVVDECRELTGLHDVEVTIEGTSGEGQVRHVGKWDRNQIQESIKSLLQNAVQAIGSGGTIRIEFEFHEGQHVMRITDTGCGIAPEIQEHVFDPFFSGREAGRGLGFGLSKAWTVAQSHGGTLRCINAAAGETCFELSLPVEPPTS